MKTSFYTPSQSIFACVASTKAKIAIPKLSHFKGHYKNSSLRQNRELSGESDVYSLIYLIIKVYPLLKFKAMPS